MSSTLRPTGIVVTLAFAGTIAALSAACGADDEPAGFVTNGTNPGANGPGGDGTQPQSVTDPASASDVPAPSVGIMGEAEITEFFARQLAMYDDKGMLPNLNCIQINQEGTFECHSHFLDTRYTVRQEYENLMPASRKIQYFSPTRAAGVFALGSRICVALFNRDMAQTARDALFGAGAFDDPTMKNKDQIFDVLIDRFALTSGADLEPVRADVRKVMDDAFDEAVAAGVEPRSALEESCTTLLGSLAPYVL